MVVDVKLVPVLALFHVVWWVWSHVGDGLVVQLQRVKVSPALSVQRSKCIARTTFFQQFWRKLLICRGKDVVLRLQVRGWSFVVVIAMAIVVGILRVRTSISLLARLRETWEEVMGIEDVGTVLVGEGDFPCMSR